MSEFLHPDSFYVSDYVAERGPTRYFHGRKRTLGNFDQLIKDSMETKGGSTFLIQGALGAGTTALLEEMGLDALEQQWNVVKIKLGDLCSPVQISQTLRKPHVSRKHTTVKIDMKLFGVEHVEGDSSMSRILEKINPSQGVLFILDEAQRIAEFSDTPDKKIQVTETLDKIQNGELPQPAILLAAGPRMSKATFPDLGISRFMGGCFVELGTLSKESEWAIIQDWLVKEGGDKGDPEERIDAIMKKTHDWPQHILAYGDAAAKQIQKDHGKMTSAGLEVVYRLGEDRCEAYYKQRSEKITRKERSSLARLMKNVSSEDGLDREDVRQLYHKNMIWKSEGLIQESTGSWDTSQSGWSLFHPDSLHAIWLISTNRCE